jgi:predicted DsbA family dithiol-disulfide isomerase
VSLAQRFAIENPRIHADCIEVTEFPEVAEKYRVYAVPKTVINEQEFVEGALPESHFLEAVLKALPAETGLAPAGETA